MRWTFCFTHAPPNITPATAEKEPAIFSKIEALLLMGLVFFLVAVWRFRFE